jgi:SAM-dependent methyltransferase
MRDAVLPERAARTRERQLAFMHDIAAEWAGEEERIVEGMVRRSRRVRAKLEAVRPIGADDHVLEVGSGGTGIVFNFGTAHGIGIDPLADDLRTLFPWQRASSVPTVAAEGERLPFPDASFDIVMSDNVVDHARSPARIVAEMARVLKPGGLLYFTVNVHHPFWHLGSRIYGAWRALGLPGEVQPFADHTVHLSPAAARRLFDGLPLRRLSEGTDVEEAKRKAAETPPRHAGDRLKRLFYKNAVYETIAVRT